MSRKYKELVNGDLHYTEGHPSIVFDQDNNHILDIRGWGRLSKQNNLNHLEALIEQTSIAQEIIDRVNGFDKLQAENAELKSFVKYFKMYQVASEQWERLETENHKLQAENAELQELLSKVYDVIKVNKLRAPNDAILKWLTLFENMIKTKDND